MHWINIHTETLRGVEFLGAEPIERATWLSLLGWCCAQENGGTIESCKEWTSRKWQQICGITLEEVSIRSDLYEFDGFDLIVHFYPLEQQQSIEAKRVNGKKGGRPRKSQPIESEGEKPRGYGLLNHVGNHVGNLDITLKERKEKESKVKEGNNQCESIYLLYPKKVGKGAAIKSIEKALKKISYEDLQSIVETYAKKSSWQDKQYIPAPAVWFNQERWEDDQAEWERPKPKSNLNTPSHHSASYVDPTKPRMS